MCLEYYRGDIFFAGRGFFYYQYVADGILLMPEVMLLGPFAKKVRHRTLFSRFTRNPGYLFEDIKYGF